MKHRNEEVMDFSRINRVLGEAYNVRQSNDIGAFQGLIIQYNKLILDENIDVNNMEFDPNTDATASYTRIIDRGTMKLSLMIGELEKLRDMEPKMANEPVATIYEPPKHSIRNGIFAVVVGGGLLALVISITFSLGQSSQIKKYDVEKFELKSKYDSIVRINASLSQTNKALQAQLLTAQKKVK